EGLSHGERRSAADRCRQPVWLARAFGAQRLRREPPADRPQLHGRAVLRGDAGAARQCVSGRDGLAFEVPIGNLSALRARLTLLDPLELGVYPFQNGCSHYCASDSGVPAARESPDEAPRDERLELAIPDVLEVLFQVRMAVPEIGCHSPGG